MIERLSIEADLAAKRYTLLIDAWRGMFTTALRARDFGSSTHAVRLVQEAYAAAEVFLDAEREHAFRIIDEVASDAHTATETALSASSADELSPAALEHLGAIESYLIDELIAQVHRDIALIRQTLRVVALKVKTSARARRIEERVALVEYQIDNTLELHFTFHDRNTRRWDSKKFVRAVWRQALLAAYNETALQVIADHGLELAWVTGPEGIKQTIALSYSPDHASYDEVRNELFHPNSNHYLVPYVPA